jgi:hypothetical protein
MPTPGQIAPCQAQCSEHPPYFPELSLPDFFPVSMTKNCSEKKTIRKHQGSHCKSDKHTDRGIKKWFPGVLSKALQVLAKACHCPRELC